MTQAKYKLENKAVLDSLLLELPDVTTGMVFGLPCYRVNVNVFATLYGEGVGIKLPAARVNELVEEGDGYVPFEPFGRKRGKEFVQINRPEPELYRQDLALFEESIQYISSKPSDKQEHTKTVAKFPPGNEEQQFRAIAELLSNENPAVTVGKMMSSPGIQYAGKVFVFHYDGKMVFRLGRDFQPESFGISQYSLLAPFKTKPPMLDWFEIPASEAHHWEVLARYALQVMMAK